LIEKIASSSEYAGRLETFKRDLIADRRFVEFAKGMWDGVRHFLEQSVRTPDSVLRAHLRALLAETGRQLGEEPRLRGQINRGMVMALESFVQDYKSGVSKFIADQVKAWDMDQLVTLIEINVGKDLQFIRFNGAMVGGLAGLALYTAEIVLKLA
jgi:uncharacterized membrane-anchored protein YjiN (DUF445 family)